ncbi:MAG: hypothetical protein ACLR6B_17665 [Blautia sp.]
MTVVNNSSFAGEGIVTVNGFEDKEEAGFLQTAKNCLLSVRKTAGL